MQAYITSEWLSEPKLTTAAEVLEAIATSKPHPGNIAQVNEAEVTDIQDSYHSNLQSRSQCFSTAVAFKTALKEADASDCSTKATANSNQCSSPSTPWASIVPFPNQLRRWTSTLELQKVTGAIRITALESYRKLFPSNNREDNPQHIIADLQHWKLKAATRGQFTGVGRKRNCTAQGTQLQGHLKVRALLAQGLLKQSGNKAQFIARCRSKQHQPTAKWRKKSKTKVMKDSFRQVEAIAQAEATPMK